MVEDEGRGLAPEGDASGGGGKGLRLVRALASQINGSFEIAVAPTGTEALERLRGFAYDGLVVDLPTAFYLAGAEIPNGKIVGQLPNSSAQGDQYGALLAKNSPLTTCVSTGIDALKADGTLAKLQSTWLADAGAPVLS